MDSDGILFDLDGTLWDSVDEIVLTWNSVIVKYPEYGTPICRRDMEGLMGLQMDDIAARLFPNVDKERQLRLTQECVTAENKYLYVHGAKLYPNVRETLAQLRRRHRLFIVSNCQNGYIEAFLHANGLEPLFDGFLCYGATGRGKADNIRQVIASYGIQSPVYVGDTQTDCQASAAAGVPFVFAAYGFGQAEQYAARIERFKDLTGLF